MRRRLHPAWTALRRGHTIAPTAVCAYIRRCPSVSLGDFLGALSVLLAKGALRFL